QKIQDFQTLASLYAKQYAPYNWKKQLLNYDLFKIQPWLDKINATTDDLGYYEVLLQYVASLDDIHSAYFTPSDFVADLRFRIDIYDGKFLIDRIDRVALPSTKYPFQIGDELVMVDNRTPDDYIQEFSALLAFANPISQRRFLAIYVTVRAQDTIPRS